MACFKWHKTKITLSSGDPAPNFIFLYSQYQNYLTTYFRLTFCFTCLLIWRFSEDVFAGPHVATNTAC